MRRALFLLAALALSTPAAAHDVSRAQARCDAALDARTVAMRAAERVVKHIAAKAGEPASAEMQAIRALALSTQMEAMEMAETRCRGRRRD